MLMYVFTNYQPTVISLGTSFTTKTFYFRDMRKQEVLLLWFWWWLQSNEAEDPTHHLSQPKWALCYINQDTTSEPNTIQFCYMFVTCVQNTPGISAIFRCSHIFLSIFIDYSDITARLRSIWDWSLQITM